MAHAPKKLWQCASKTDELLDRILIVHRYLEGAGLDASEKKILHVCMAPNFSKLKQVVKHPKKMKSNTFNLVPLVSFFLYFK